MKNNLLCAVMAAFLLAISTAAAQPANGLPIPAKPTAADMQATEKEVDEKARQLRRAELAYENSKLAMIQSSLLQWGVPQMATVPKETALQKRAYPGFLVGFSAEHGQPQWSYHTIQRDIFDVCLVREEDFFEDLSLTGASRLAQYRSSGFQRGHLAPAADFRWSPRASMASNLLANISPQHADFNEGLWAELEISIRRYLQVRDSLSEVLIVTGPVLEPGLKKLKDTSHVSIPKQFFKIVVNLKEEQGFAFLIETSAKEAGEKKLEAELRKRAMTIDALEKILQINFFPNFSAAQNKNMESQIDMDDWFAVPGESLGSLPAPVTDPALLTDAFNTAMITSQNFKEKPAVVGTVTRVSVGASGGIVLFLDNLPPNHKVQILIQARDADKFKSPTPQNMLGKIVRATGTLSPDGERFRMSIRDPKKLVVLKG